MKTYISSFLLLLGNMWIVKVIKNYNYWDSFYWYLVEVMLIVGIVILSDFFIVILLCHSEPKSTLKSYIDTQKQFGKSRQLAHLTLLLMITIFLLSDSINSYYSYQDVLGVNWSRWYIVSFLVKATSILVAGIAYMWVYPTGYSCKYGKWHYLIPVMVITVVLGDIRLGAVNAVLDLNTSTKIIQVSANNIRVEKRIHRGNGWRYAIDDFKEYFIVYNGEKYFINHAMSNTISKQISAKRIYDKSLTLRVVYYPHSKIVKSYTLYR